MLTSIHDPRVETAIREAQAAAARRSTQTVMVHGQPREVPRPFPSPADWRDLWIYFLLIDRFSHPSALPRGAWNQRYNLRQGGTFKGIEAQLDYLADLGCHGIWISPVLKNSRPEWEFNYHGYGAQDFLNVDERFGSDGTLGTAESELKELVAQAHARGLYVILDIVINHAARVFDYVIGGNVRHEFTDAGLLHAPLGSEAAIQWLNGFGNPRPDWQEQIPPGTPLSSDDAVYPEELRERLFFRRRGSKISDSAPAGGYVPGDFGTMRQLVTEYDAGVPGQEQFRQLFGRYPVLSIFVRVHQYLIAAYDFDGFRIDTVKYVHPNIVEMFGNAIREFALSIGKKNFFTFGEIYDNEQTIANFVGRNSSSTEGFGIDAALDFPLFFELPAIAKAMRPVETLRGIFEQRKAVESQLISTHGEAGRFFVSFLDNHDQHERFNHPGSHPDQITLGLALMFCLQGIPCLYYGTEQGLSGTVNAQGQLDLSSNESSREALWGKTPIAFDRNAPLFRHIQAISSLRVSCPALKFGRLYFREMSANGRDFGHSSGVGGLVAFSRILSSSEAVIVANTNTQQRFDGWVLVDADLNRNARRLEVLYSNRGTSGGDQVRRITDATFYRGGQPTGRGEACMLFVGLAPMEVQVLV